ncbi:hypothetical protein A2U01_0075878, partial [Trifolium medium]|nr:hypothetical protein [Trifolium medium]
MTTPFRGRSRGRGHSGRGRGRIYLPEDTPPDYTFPLLGDWTTVNYRSQFAGAIAAQAKKEKEEAASS